MDYSRINEETVEWAYRTADGLLKEELERARLLTDKAAQLAGFSGIVLAILGGMARDAFGAALGSPGEAIFAACFFAAAGVLTAAIAWLIVLVYRPRRYVAVDTGEIRNYLEDERLLQAKPWALQIRTMRTLYPAARWAEKTAGQLAFRITVGASLFLIGLFLFLGAVITLGIGVS